MKKRSYFFVLAIAASLFLTSVGSTKAAPPVAENDTGLLSEGGSLDIIAPGVLLNDEDPEGGGLVVTTTPVSDPSHGILVLRADGSYLYTHDGSQTTSDSFIYEVCDTEPLCSQATVSLTIVEVNDAPIPGTDSASVAEGGNVAVSAPGVLANDSDEEGHQLSVNTSPVTPPSHGSLSLAIDGSYSYTHDGSETTSDSFVYQVCDNGSPSLCANGTVNISIQPVNDPPQAQTDEASVFEGDSVTVAAPGVLGNDSDPDVGDTIRVDPVTPTSPPQHGDLTLAADGWFTYVHDGSETTSDSFDYRVCDSGTPKLCTTGTVNITIEPLNDAPIPADDAVTVAEGDSVTVNAPGVLENDTDAEANNLSVTTTPLTDPTYGSVTLGSDGGYTYMHNGSEMDSDSFVYQVCDDGEPFECASATVNVTVTPVNDIPALDLNGSTPGTGTITPFAVGGGAVLITSNELRIIDADDGNMESAVVSFVSFPDGASETLTTDTTGTSIVATYNALQGELLLTGTDTVANYERVLRNVRYDNSLQAPNTAARNINFSVNDGEANSNIATAVVNIVDSKIELFINPSEQDVNIGETALFTIVITNTGNVDLTNVDISNTLVPNCDRSLEMIPAGQPSTYSCEFPNVTNSFLNQATVTAQDPLNETVTDSASAFVNLSNPILAVIISPDTQDVAFDGTANFTIGVLNISAEVDLTNVDVTVPEAPNCNRTIGTVAAGNNTGYSCSLSNITSDIALIATVTANNADNGSPINASDFADVQVFDMGIELVASPDVLRQPGGVVQFTATVVNYSTAKELTLSSLESTPYGDLTDADNPMLEDTSCSAGVSIGIRGDSYTCAFEVNIEGLAGTYETAVTALAEDDEARTIERMTVATVQMIQKVYMPVVPNDRRIDEPNNDACQAFPVELNVTNEFLANDVNDWYRFSLTESGEVNITLSNFVNASGQLILWDGSCQNPSLISLDVIDSDSLIVNAGTLDVGTYYILITNFGSPDLDNFYELRVNFGS
ncbi:MAG: Ig-like domain-containing protein [Chloroflexota bacterium]